MKRRFGTLWPFVALLAWLAAMGCRDHQAETPSTVSAGTLASRPNEAVDRTIQRRVDVTGDGVEDSVFLRVRGTDVRSPFTWQVVIRSEEKEIFSYSGESSSFDAFFGDDGYVGGCHGYIDCKERFFYRDILDHLIVPETGYSRDALLDESAPNGLYATGRTFLKECCALDGERADAILASMAERLRSGRAVVMSNLTSGVSMEPHAAMFAPEVGRFIPIYEP